MRVLQLSTYDGGQGAARAAFRLHRALRDAGVDSAMRVAAASTGDAWVEAPRSKPRQALALLRSTASWWLQKPQRSANPITHSLAALPSCLHRELNRRQADLLHLHWLQDEFLSVEAIGRLRGPVFWTLHDTWPFCGSEHYPAAPSDRRFSAGYLRGNRPAGDRGLDLDRWVWRRKRGAWAQLLPRLQLIAPSRWMAEQAAASVLFAGVPCAVIPNALPPVFRPIEKARARELLGWPQQQRLILFGAMDGSADPRKGWDLLEAALHRLVADAEGLPLAAVVLGQAPPRQPPSMPLPLRFAGRLHDDLSLALAYAAADVVVVPSRLDNLPQSATEALACGTPVVAFRQGGLEDLVEHRVSGWLAQPFNPHHLALGIAWCLNTPGLAPSPARLSGWRPAAVAEAHTALYGSVLER
jgi:glycosyltransferase involved in cell wall biosynthesis